MVVQTKPAVTIPDGAISSFRENEYAAMDAANMINPKKLQKI
jgi:hypothetical protein